MNVRFLKSKMNNYNKSTFKMKNLMINKVLIAMTHSGFVMKLIMAQN